MKLTTGLFTLLLATHVPALMAGTIVPNANATTAGNTDNRFPFLVTGGIVYEQVFAASQFSGPLTIGEIDFRNGILVNQAFSVTIANIQISLSTVSVGPDGLSTNFASNLGADNTVVYNGSLTISSANGAGPGNTKEFDIAIHLQTPFAYNPAAGNLLLFIDNISGVSSNVGTDYFDAVNTVGDSVSRLIGVEGSPHATSGLADSLGLIAQFGAAPTAAPEPGYLVLTGLGVALIGSWRRKTSFRN